MTTSSHLPIQEAISDALLYNSVDGCYLQDEAFAEDDYILIEDLDERLSELQPTNVAAVLSELSQTAQYFVRHYSKYDRFISLLDIQQALDKRK